MPKKRQYMQKFRAYSPQKKKKHLTITLRWLLALLGRSPTVTK